MNISTQKIIYPIAIKNYLDKNLQGTNYGNLENNMNIILKDIGIGNILKSSWKLPPLFFIDKRNISKDENCCDDFDEFTPFRFSFELKKEFQIDDYNNAINKLETLFLTQYQGTEILLKARIKKRKSNSNSNSNQIYTTAAIVSIVLMIFIALLKLKIISL